VAPETILAALLRVQLVASAAIVLVLLLRPLVLRRFGATLAYGLWLLVPITMVSVVLPARELRLIQPIVQKAETLEPAAAGAPQSADARQALAQTPARAAAGPGVVDMLLALWLVGAGALLLRSILNTRRLASDPDVGPALVGVLRPRLVLPRDFETRFNARERTLILAHEQVHRISRHPLVNSLVELARCASWFNPLMHLAAVRLRADQELACDAAVLAAHPQQAHTDGQALLKTQIDANFLPLGCVWTSPSARRLHERLSLLDSRSPTSWKKAAGALVIAFVGMGACYTAWAQRPARIVTQNVPVPAPLWTATASAPKGSLSTALEGDRHDRAIKRAQQGHIDMVLFGTTNAEMFWWPDRGRPVWDQHFKSLQAANFGSQGTQRDSLIWRLRNGELSGYEAKLVVVQTWLGAAAVTARDNAIGTYAPIIAEIRKYQPQAKILLFADFPRGQLNRDAWREVSKANAAAFANLVDNRTVFYVDIGERFYLPDGTHNQKMWRFPPLAGLSNVGMQPAGFEAWAEELQPWIDRFVR
jgi:beta-lactamase regulating signal transducer with metallopeptidase domain